MDKMNVPLCRPSITDKEKNVVIEVMESGWMAHGPYNKKLETGFCDYLGVKESITMNSCTSALEVALQVNNIKGDVIVPSFTFVAVANSVVTSGATPVFCDVDLETRNMTLDKIKEAYTPSTEAVILVHYGGQPCNLDEIGQFCEEKGLLLIEDCAETIGGTWNGKKAGSVGVGCFSFFPTKNMTTGEGGLLTTNDSAMAERARVLIAHGLSSTTFAREKVKKPWIRSAVNAGFNYRMSNMLAGIGYYQLQRLDEMNENRCSIAERYLHRLEASKALVRLPITLSEASHVWQMFTIVVDSEMRDDLVGKLRERGVGASVHFDPPIHKQEYYRDKFLPSVSLENTEKLAESLVTLPIFPDMTMGEADYVVDNLLEVMA